MASSKISLLRLALRKGYDVNCVMSFQSIQIPLLVFSVMHSHLTKIDTSAVVAVLLGAGANVTEQIPPWYFESATKELEPNPLIKSLTTNAKQAWCTVPDYLTIFEAALDMYKRQWLSKASKLSFRPRNLQIAKLRRADTLMELSYTLVGQHLAITRMHDTLMDRMYIPKMNH